MEPNWDEICPYYHKETKQWIWELTDALFADDWINNEFIEEKLELLCDKYGVKYPQNKRLDLAMGGEK